MDKKGEYAMLREMDARKLPWSEYGIDIVVDCSGA